MASAFTAALAIALPPRRPRTAMNGAPRCRRQCRLRFRGADEAHRHADDQRRPRRPGVEQFQQPEQGGRRVADGHHRARQMRPPQIHRRGRAGVADPPGEVGHLGVVQRADHLVGGGQAGAGDAGVDHAAVAQHRRAGGQSGPAGGAGAGGEQQVIDHVRHAAGMRQPHRQLFQVGRDAREVGLGADDGEGAGVYVVRVAAVVDHGAVRSREGGHRLPRGLPEVTPRSERRGLLRARKHVNARRHRRSAAVGRCRAWQ